MGSQEEFDEHDRVLLTGYKSVHGVIARIHQNPSSTETLIVNMEETGRLKEIESSNFDCIGCENCKHSGFVKDSSTQSGYALCPKCRPDNWREVREWISWNFVSNDMDVRKME